MTNLKDHLGSHLGLQLLHLEQVVLLPFMLLLLPLSSHLCLQHSQCLLARLQIAVGSV